MRRAYAKRQAQAATFPRWPIEPPARRAPHHELRAGCPSDGGRAAAGQLLAGRHALRLRPDPRRRGRRRASRTSCACARSSSRHGFVSSWNFCAEEYPIPDGTLRRARAAGCEIGLHGDRPRLQAVRHARALRGGPAGHPRYMREWGAVGFRSPGAAPQRRLDARARLPATTPRFPTPTRSSPSPAAAARSCRTSSATSSSCRSRSSRTTRSSRSCGSDTSTSGARRPPGSREHHGLVNVIVHPDYCSPRAPRPLRGAARVPGRPGGRLARPAARRRRVVARPPRARRSRTVTVIGRDPRCPVAYCPRRRAGSSSMSDLVASPRAGRAPRPAPARRRAVCAAMIAACAASRGPAAGRRRRPRRCRPAAARLRPRTLERAQALLAQVRAPEVEVRSPSLDGPPNDLGEEEVVRAQRAAPPSEAPYL